MSDDACCDVAAAGGGGGVLSSVIADDVVFVSSMSVDWLSRTLYWVDSARASMMYRAWV